MLTMYFDNIQYDGPAKDLASSTSNTSRANSHSVDPKCSSICVHCFPAPVRGSSWLW